MTLLNIVVADDQPVMREYFERILPLLGHRVVAAVATGRELIEAAREFRPHLIVTDVKMPDMDGIAAAVELYRDYPVPIILVSAYPEPELIARPEADHIMAYLIKPIKQAELELSITLAMRRFNQFQQLQQEANDLRQALNDRKIIERAKGLLMKRDRLDEVEAFRRLKRMASDRNWKLVEMANAVLAEP